MSSRSRVLAVAGVACLAVIGAVSASLNLGADGTAAGRHGIGVGSAPSETSSTPISGLSSLGPRRPTLKGVPVEGVADAQGRASAAIRLQEAAGAGRVKRVVLIPGAPSDANPSIPDEARHQTGVGLEYEDGTILRAVPLGTSPAPDFRAMRASEVASVTFRPFLDGRTTGFDVRTINGRDTLVAEAGIQVDPGHPEYRNEVPAVVWFVYDGVQYFLVSADGPAERLVRIAASIK